MKVAEIRALGTDEIQAKLDDAYKAIFNMRFQAASGQLEDMNRMKALWRDVARMKTILRERELAARANVGEGGES